MDTLPPLLLLIHLAAMAAWVGGMFFAYACLRPAAAELLEPPLRLPLWRRVFARFFAWVWAAVVLIPATGMAMMTRVGMAAAPLGWHLMMTGGAVMIVVFIYVYVRPYPALCKAVDRADWAAGGSALAQIRRLVGMNLILGGLTLAFAAFGRVLG